MYLIKIALICIVMARPVTLQSHHESGCSGLNNAFQTFCSRQSDRFRSVAMQGAPGKRGPIGGKGQKGERGALGPSGEVDYSLIDRSIEEKIQQEMRSHVAALVKANERIKELEDRQGFCAVKYDGKCFWTEVRYESITFDAGQRICASLGAKPANIYSQEHYGRIERYVRSLIYPGQSILQPWIGLQYSAKTRQVLLSNESVATFEKWHGGFPRKSDHRMGINVRVPWDASAQYMWNIDNFAATGVICEI